MIGTTLGHYKILDKLGAGGMGEVYRAEDTTLDREVALKLLPDELSADPDRLARFEREAKTLAALDHPNIIHIYTVEESEGVRFITMQLVEGNALSEMIPKGGMTLERFLDITVPLADALATAHEKGVIHRDLKPANIMVTEEGRVKVLDFGLAKMGLWSDAGKSQAETVASPANLTRPGLALGTVAYMSPEQALGKELDQRTDLFSLGVVLYEMATGGQPFHGEAPGSILNEIINQAPTPVLDLNPELPEPLGGIVEKCLEKEPDLRYQSARGLMGDLKRLQRDTTSGVSTVQQPAPAEAAFSRRGLRWLAVGLVVIGLAALAWWLLPGRTQEASLPPPSITPFTTDGGWKDIPSLSPDGERVAYAWRGPTDDLDIYVKSLGTGAEPLRLTNDPGEEASPVWSPDGRQIGFIRSSEFNSAIYVVPSMGGPERKLTDLVGPLPAFPVLSWSPDGRRIAFSEKSAEEHSYRIVALSLETLERKNLTSPPPDFGGDSRPKFSPDGSQVAFVRRVEEIWGNNDVWVQSLEGGESRPVTSEQFLAIHDLSWTPDGEEIIFSEGIVPSERAYRVPVDGGIPELMAGLGTGSTGIRIVGNRMVYRQARAGIADIWRSPGRHSSPGERIPERLIKSSAVDLQPRISPDGSQIAFSSYRSGVGAIWLVQSDGSHPAQLTGNDSAAGTPGWSPDGRQIVFDSLESGSFDIWVVDAEGGVPRQLTFEPSNDGRPSWSRDGRWIYFGSDRTGTAQIWKIEADGGEVVQITREGGYYARESWDGKTLYYAKSDESTGLWQVPLEGGEETEIVSGPIPVFWSWDVSVSGIYYWKTLGRSAAFTRYDYGYHGINTLYFEDFSTGEVSDLLRREGAPIAQNVVVSPDEEWILFAEIPAGESELILVENFR